MPHYLLAVVKEQVGYLQINCSESQLNQLKIEDYDLQELAEENVTNWEDVSGSYYFENPEVITEEDFDKDRYCKQCSVEIIG